MLYLLDLDVASAKVVWMVKKLLLMFDRVRLSSTELYANTYFEGKSVPLATFANTVLWKYNAHPMIFCICQSRRSQHIA